MANVVLLAGRLLLLALLYLFLLAAIRAGIGLIAGQAPKRQDRGLVVAVSRGPSELLGTRVPLPLQIAELTAKGQYAALTAEDLRLRLEESMEVLERRLGAVPVDARHVA